MPEFGRGLSDPSIVPDVGAGVWRSAQPTALIQQQRGAIVAALGSQQSALQGLPGVSILGNMSRRTLTAEVGDDAVKHMDHYFDNSGTDYVIDLEGMIAESPDAKTTYEVELAAVLDWVGRLPPGNYDFNSRRAVQGYNRNSPDPGARNWFFAVGGYASWSRGRAAVWHDLFGRPRHELDWEYCIFDRYNWDGGKLVRLPILNIMITDEFMGEFHRCGLAREFDMHGVVRRHFRWNEDAPPVGVDSGRIEEAPARRA